MASRSLTDVFLLMRSNAMRNRHIYPDQGNEERLHLVSLDEMEEGIGSRLDHQMPPAWIDYFEKAQMIMPNLKTKIIDLKTLQSKHLHRLTFDETSNDEAAIENCSNEISRMFNEIHRLVQIIKSHSLDGTIKEQRLAVNVYQSLALTLQELTQGFKNTQNSYLRELKSREDRSKMYFDSQLVNDYFNSQELDQIDDDFVNAGQMTQQQLLYLEEESMRLASEREDEVNHIVRSILDLNKIFRDLSQLVADQGTVLDRIDYNLEKTHIEVVEGYKQLRKAEAYQRKNRKMCCIMILGATTIILLFL